MHAWVVALVLVSSFGLADAEAARGRFTLAAVGTAAVTVAQPTSAHDLLVNIQSALDQGWLLSNDFYADSVLRNFFAAADIQWIVATDTDKYARLLGVQYIPVHDDHPPRLGVTWISLDAAGRKSKEGKREAAFSLSCACALRVADIEKVFGTQQRSIAPDRRLAGTHHPKPRDPTDPLGNQILTYEFDAAGRYVSTLSVVFDPDGNITLVEARQRER